MHGIGAGQVGGDRLTGGALAVGEAERQSRVERLGQAARHPGAGGGGHRGGRVPALGQRGLQHERFVPLQPLAGGAVVVYVQRPVNGPDGLGEAAEPVAFP